MRARIETDQGPAKALVLGPEPIIGAQRVILMLNDRSFTLATDGLGPFTTPVEETDSPAK